MLKILRRRTPLIHLICFVLLLPLFLFTADALYRGRTVFSLSSLQLYVSTHLPLFGLAGLVALAFYSCKKMAIWLFLILLALPIYSYGQLLFWSFEKLIFVHFMIYLLLAAYFYLLAKTEYQEVVYNPNFALDDLELVPLRTVLGQVTFPLIEGQPSLEAVLTNWGPDSAFLAFPNLPQTQYLWLLKQRRCRLIKLTIAFGDQQIESTGTIYSYCPKVAAFGVVWKDPGTGWKGFYQQMVDRAILPENML